MATGHARSAEHELTSGSRMQQPQTHLENIVVSDHARAHFGNNYNGPISYTTTIHEAVSSTSIEQPRLLPRAANRQFVGYAHVLDRLKSCFLDQDSADHDHGQITCVLSGMGGVGKSETVLQFLDKNDTSLRERFWGIFWVDCESEASARTDFERIGNTCGWSLSGGNVVSGVKDQLASSKKRTLLILDNCDDMKTDYNRYIPHASQVSVVMTTRLSDARNYASVDPGDSKSKLFLQLHGLAADPAINLLLEASEILEQDWQSFDHAKQIVTALDYHPLAITVGSSLIRSAVYSLKEYVDALQNQLAQKELLETDSVQARYRKVSTTFEVSARHLQRSASTDPSAKAALALLDILGFMHHQNVYEEIFSRAWEEEEDLLCWIEDEHKDDGDDITHLSAWHVARCRSIFSPLPPSERMQLFRKARAHLGRMSLVRIDHHQNCMSLHLMVHSWARDRVKCPSETWSAVAATLALSAKGNLGWQPYMSQLVPHYEKNFDVWQEMGMMDSDQWEVCRIWYVYACQMRRAAQSMAMLKICLQLMKQTEELCQDHLEKSAFADVNYLLGAAYVATRQITKAVLILTQASKLREKLAEDHRGRLDSQHELARAYLADGQVTHAIDMIKHVVQVQEKKLAEDHPDRLASQHELARAYLADGKITEAIRILEHVVKVKEEKLAEDHPERLVSQHELARAYLEDRQVTKAIVIFEHIVKVQEKLVEDHPNRLASQHELARAYGYNGQTTKAIELVKPVVAIRRLKYDAGHRQRFLSEDMLSKLMKEKEDLALTAGVTQTQTRLHQGETDTKIEQSDEIQA